MKDGDGRWETGWLLGGEMMSLEDGRWGERKEGREGDGDGDGGRTERNSGSGRARAKDRHKR